ncbi:MAG: hypothetical protein K0R18_2070 [Bacillales bacterium]|jgi:uncharacterized protein YjbK|nr:hypothetical protein [Bacillales bacterium]
MSENLEIEFKNILTETEFNHLILKFKLTDSAFWSQTNYYFDTTDFSLKDTGCALRIREKNKGYELTLKQPTENSIGLLEINQHLEESTAKSFIENGIFPNGPVEDRVSKILSSNMLKMNCFGRMKTERTELEYGDGLLVFDKSSYFNVVDYELEFEVKDYEIGQKMFLDLLKNEHIPVRKTLNKVRRFYNEMRKQQSVENNLK